MTAHVQQNGGSSAVATACASQAACRDCSEWKIIAERTLSAILKEVRTAGDITSARVLQIVDAIEVTESETDAGCAHLRLAA